MKRKWAYMVVGIVTLLAIGAGSVFAFGSCLTCVDMIQGIKLTDAQKTKLQSLETEHKKKMIKYHSDMALAHIDKEVLLKDKNFKKDDVEKQIRKMMAVKTDMELEKLSAMNNLRSVLTDEQWKIFAEHMGKRGMCGRDGIGMMCDGMGGMDMRGGHGMGMGMKHCPMKNKADSDKE